MTVTVPATTMIGIAITFLGAFLGTAIKIIRDVAVVQSQQGTIIKHLERLNSRVSKCEDWELRHLEDLH